MSSPSFNYFYRVEIQAANYNLGGYSNYIFGEEFVSSSTVRELDIKTCNFINKVAYDASSANRVVREEYYPILLSVGEVTFTAGDVIPTSSLSSITISDARGSFGPDRKFSDMLTRYTVINQPIKLYLGESETNADAPIGWTQVGEGTIASWSSALNDGEPTLVFNITPFKISDRIMTLEVSRDVQGMESCNDTALGRSLPIVFNKVRPLSTDIETYPQVQPVRISADGSRTLKLACSTQQYKVTKATWPQSIWIQKPWDSDGQPWGVAKFGISYPDYTTPLVAGTSYTLNTYEALAFRIPNFTDSALIVTGVELKAKAGGGAIATEQSLSVEILLVNKTTLAVQTLSGASGFTSLANYSSQNAVAGTIFSIKIALNAPVVIEPGINDIYDFYLSFSASETNATSPSLCKYDFPGATYPVLRKASSNSNAWAISTDPHLLAHKLLVATAAFDSGDGSIRAANKYGFDYSFLTISQPAVDIGQIGPSLDSLQVVVPMEGFYKVLLSAPVYSPATALEYLSLEWNGEAWVDESTVNAGAFAELTAKLFTDTPASLPGNITYRARGLSGILDNKQTYANVLTEIARGTACRIGIDSEARLTIYPWGCTSTVAYHIPEADIAPLNWEARDDAFVVNRAIVTANQIYTTTPGSRGDSYSVVIDYNREDFKPVSEITERSFAIFGLKSASENIYNVFGFNDLDTGLGLPGYLTGGPVPGLTDDEQSQPTEGGEVVWSVDPLADYYISRFGLPLNYASFVVPYHRYQGIKLFDVITFSHSAFPAFYGTDPNAKPGVVDDGSSVTRIPNANFGGELTRAQTYRGIVEAVSLVLAMEHAPAIRITVQVLQNRIFDPT